MEIRRVRRHCRPTDRNIILHRLFHRHYPASTRIERVRMSIASPLTRPSPNGRRFGIRIVAFEACSGFTHVTARRIAQPPTGSYRINRQLSEWILPPLMSRAFGAHCHKRSNALRQKTYFVEAPLNVSTGVIAG
jgi:hypothetical protein